MTKAGNYRGVLSDAARTKIKKHWRDPEKRKIQSEKLKHNHSIPEVREKRRIQADQIKKQTERRKRRREVQAPQGAPHLFRNGTLEARKKMRAAAKCEWKRRNKGKPNGPDLCGAIVLENNRLMWPQEIYREAIKRGFWEGKKMPKNPKGNIARLAKRVCGFYNKGKKSYTEPRIEIVVLGKKKVEFKPK